MYKNIIKFSLKLRNKNKPNGFTLVEILLIISVASVSLFATLSLITNVQKSQSTTTASRSAFNTMQKVRLSLIEPQVCELSFKDLVFNPNNIQSELTIDELNTPVGPIVISGQNVSGNVFINNIKLTQFDEIDADLYISRLIVKFSRKNIFGPGDIDRFIHVILKTTNSQTQGGKKIESCSATLLPVKASPAPTTASGGNVIASQVNEFCRMIGGVWDNSKSECLGFSANLTGTIPVSPNSRCGFRGQGLNVNCLGQSVNNCPPGYTRTQYLGGHDVYCSKCAPGTQGCI